MGGIVYVFWVICGRIVTIISFPGAMLFKIDTNQSIFQCHKWITEIIIIYYINYSIYSYYTIIIIQSQSCPVFRRGLQHTQFLSPPLSPSLLKVMSLGQMSSNHFILYSPFFAAIIPLKILFGEWPYIRAVQMLGTLTSAFLSLTPKRLFRHELL